MDYVYGFLAIVSLWVSLSLLLVAIKIARADKSVYESYQKMHQGISSALKGEVRNQYGDTRDYRICAGLAIDRKTGEWKEQGKLSDEAIDRILG